MSTTLPRLLMFIALSGAFVSSNIALASNNVDGTLLGEVTSGDVVLEGAVVSVRHLDTGQSRSTITSTTGSYSFSRLVPGEYEITVRADGFKSVSRKTVVYAGIGTPIHFSLESGEIEEVVVTGARELPVDSSSVEKSTLLTATQVELLPVSRNIESVALLTPGTLSGDRAFGNLVSFSGSSVAENVYYINGMNVTDFRRGLGGSSIPFEFYDQFQFKSGGFSAEYGRSTGGVLSGITQRGKSNWNVRTGYITTPEFLRSYNPDIPHPSREGQHVSFSSRDKSYSSQYFLSAGGPLVPNRLFFHGIFLGRDHSSEDYSESNRLYKSKSKDPFWGGKVDWIVGDRHRIELTAFSDETTGNRSTYDWNRAAGVVGEHLGDNSSNRGGQNFIGNYVGRLGSNFTVSLLTGRNRYDRTNQSAQDNTCPAAIDSRSGQIISIGCWTNLTSGSSLDTRRLYRADFEVAFGYRHLVRFGLDHETNTSEDSRQYSGPNGGEYFRYYTVTPGATLNNGGIVPNDITTLVRYRLYRRGGSFKTTARAWYIEDLWTISSSVSARIGLRNEGFVNRNANGQTFIEMENQWAPRLGVAWDVQGFGTSRLFVNLGRYHLPIANNTNVRLAGRELFSQDWYTLGSAIAEDGSVTLGQRIGPTTVYGDGSVLPADQVIDTTVRPMYQDEFIIGYETEFRSSYRGSLTYTHRVLGRAIEDITIDESVGLPGEFHYILTNPGTSVRTRYDVDKDGIAELIELSAEQLGYPKPVRKFHGLTFALKKTWENDSYADVTYTWSHSYGNYEGLVRSDNGQTDAGITTLFDFAGLMEGAYGDLPNDRRHSVKLLGVVRFLQSWQTSLSASYMHGRPRNAFGVHPSNPYAAAYGAESFYRQGILTPRGSLGRTEGIFNVDMGLQIRKELWSHTLRVKLDVFNVLNTDGIVEVREIADQSTGAASPTFGLPAAFQRPRTVRLSITYDVSL
ncbi:MAG: TonB-dependent receptor [Gammaproteobacteria bacterium]|nr:TonB-dependent receptor [Gammaproteobacteria bacterium]MYD80121.1 TonB-dependent receptor [Gammaproteobacteria bacterium]